MNGRDGENVLLRYLGEIGRIPRLTAEEEQRLARRAAGGDRAARDALVKANLRFVVAVARSYRNAGLPLEDLISEGNIGLIRAVERFDPDRGKPFVRYAVWWIRQSILKALCDGSRTIRLPANRANELARVERERELMQAESGGAAMDELARRLAMSRKRLAGILGAPREVVSLDTPVHGEEENQSLLELLQDERGSGYAALAAHRSVREEIDQVLRTLGWKEAGIVRERFGLDGEEPKTLREVGTRYRLTKERVRQIEQRALAKLRQAPELGVSGYLS